jgi:hypothetical protein
MTDCTKFDPGVTFMTTHSLGESIRDGGLRYVKKKPGSGFETSNKTRSCYACSKHHPQSEGVTVGVLGRPEFFCSMQCKEKLFKSRK